MLVEYIPESIDFWIHFYKSSINNQPQYHLGGELPGFRAYYALPQHGAGLGSFFKSLYRLALPLFKSAGMHALNAGSKIASDVAQGYNLRESALKHGREAAGSVLHEAANKISGKGLGKRKRNPNKLLRFKKRSKRKIPPFNTRKLPQVVGSDIFGD